MIIGITGTTIIRTLIGITIMDIMIRGTIIIIIIHTIAIIIRCIHIVTAIITTTPAATITAMAQDGVRQPAVRHRVRIGL